MPIATEKWNDSNMKRKRASTKFLCEHESDKRNWNSSSVVIVTLIKCLIRRLCLLFSGTLRTILLHAAQVDFNPIVAVDFSVGWFIVSREHAFQVLKNKALSTRDMYYLHHALNLLLLRQFNSHQRGESLRRGKKIIVTTKYTPHRPSIVCKCFSSLFKIKVSNQ